VSTDSPTSPNGNRYQRAPKAGLIVDLFTQPRGPITLTRFLECFYCGGQVTYANATFDHIYPRVQSHPDLADCADNLVVACSPCNLSKGTKTWEDWYSFLWDRTHEQLPPYNLVPNANHREVAITKRYEIISAIIRYRQLDHLHDFDNNFPLEHFVASIVRDKESET